MQSRLIENVRSGDQVVCDGRWDRVHGVDVSDGVVTVDSDSGHRGEYPVGTIVTVV